MEHTEDLNNQLDELQRENENLYAQNTFLKAMVESGQRDINIDETLSQVNSFSHKALAADQGVYVNQK